MKSIKNGIVFSEDIKLIMNGCNALNFSYKKRGIIIPDKSLIDALRKDFKLDVDKIFNKKVVIITEEEMKNGINSTLDMLGKIPIISLDKIYLKNDNKNIIFLDCTRLDGSNELVSRNNPNIKNDVEKQINIISNELIKNNEKKIVLADDVVFSGEVLKTIIKMFNKKNINVIGIRSAISTRKAYEYFSKILPYGIYCEYLLENEVIDQICERDFYFGIAQSGISIKNMDNKIYKSPYFKPFGNPVDRASIPKKYEKTFSKGCIERSLELWENIEKLSKKELYVNELPERINNTNIDDKIVKVLRKELKR